MRVTVNKRMLSSARPLNTWLEPGDYDLVRFFSARKALIDVTPPTSLQRQLTIVTLGRQIFLDEKNKDTARAY